MGGDRTNCPFDCGMQTAELLTIKLLLNSVISTPGAKFTTIDISNFYLNTPIDRYEYMRMKLDMFPEDVIEEYNLRDKVEPNSYVYIEVRKGMYGLPQAGLLAQKLLKKRLGKHGYKQSDMTPGLWTHEWRPICFTLVVDNFGVKYVGDKHAAHLQAALRETYKIEVDEEGDKCVGISLDWDYDNGEVNLSIPGYVSEALARFKHFYTKKGEDQPYAHVVPNYGVKVQYAADEDTSQLATKKEKTYIQQVVGTFLYYGRAVDGTMLTALSAIASEQASPTANTLKKARKFMDYAATHSDAILTYRRSDIHLAVVSDTSYLSEPKARSRAGGHFFLASDVPIPANNGAVLNTANLIKTVMSSAAGAEMGAIFLNTREAIPARNALIEMGHLQGQTPIQTDNSTAGGVCNKNMQCKRSKSWDTFFGWDVRNLKRCSVSTGVPVQPTWPTTSQSITLQPTTRTCNPNSSRIVTW